MNMNGPSLRMLRVSLLPPNLYVVNEDASSWRGVFPCNRVPKQLERFAAMFTDVVRLPVGWYLLCPLGKPPASVRSLAKEMGMSVEDIPDASLIPIDLANGITDFRLDPDLGVPPGRTPVDR